jgi:hypothetical protein
MTGARKSAIGISTSRHVFIVLGPNHQYVLVVNKAEEKMTKLVLPMNWQLRLSHWGSTWPSLITLLAFPLSANTAGRYVELSFNNRAIDPGGVLLVMMTPVE